MNKQTTADIKENVKNSSVWVRLLFMLLFVVFYSTAEIVLLAVVLYQFLSLLITAQKNDKILAFGAQLASYTYQVFSYLTFNSEQKPFPMSDWPSAKPLIEDDACSSVANAEGDADATEEKVKPADVEKEVIDAHVEVEKVDCRAADDAVLEATSAKQSHS